MGDLYTEVLLLCQPSFFKLQLDNISMCIGSFIFPNSSVLWKERFVNCLCNLKGSLFYLSYLYFGSDS